jgi:glucokinase
MKTDLDTLVNNKNDSTPWILGIDIGGTSLKASCTSIDGKSIQDFALPTRDIDWTEVIDSLFTKVYQIAKNQNTLPSACASTFPGILDGEGVIQGSPNLTSWQGIHLTRILSEGLGCPATSLNDANAALLAESLFREWPADKTLILLTLGTGIGGGILINGKPWYGKFGFAAELGHITAVPNGKKCGCGRRGCVEQYFGAIALETQIKNNFKDSDKKPTIPELFAATEGTLENNLILEACDHLATALSNICSILAPDLFVLGGGISLAGQKLLVPLNKAYISKTSYPGYSLPKIELALTGSEAGTKGTLIIAKDLLK